MKTIRPKLSLIALAVSLAVSPVHAESEGVPATLTGENYCLHCSLVMEEGADAECGPETCSYALKVKSAKNKDGDPIEGLEGSTIHYITSGASAKLTKDGELFGREVKITGSLFPEERAVHVESAEQYNSLADELDDWEFIEPKNKASARR